MAIYKLAKLADVDKPTEIQKNVMLTTCFYSFTFKSIMLTTGFLEKPVWQTFLRISKVDIL